MTASNQGFMRVGRYEILLELRDEGFVSVMIARVRGPNAGPRIVELSRVERTLAREVEVKAAFLAEARAAGRVRHANFLHPCDTLVQDGDLYGTTEFLLGVRLEELWRAAAAERYEIPLAVSLRILLDSLLGLSALHASGANTAGSRAIVHGDISPTNILITHYGETKIVHSGLSTVTRRAGAIGTRNARLDYKAPEQLLSGVNAMPIGPAADVFAVGVLLWEMLRGARLFEHDSDVDVVEHILHGSIPQLELDGRRYMPIALLPLVANALERNPDVRTPNAAALAEAIERAPGVRLASTEEVAAVVDQLMGPLIERRRRRLEELIAHAELVSPSEVGSLRPVVGSHARPGSMRTPVGIVYPPPSYGVQSARPTSSSEISERSLEAPRGPRTSPHLRVPTSSTRIPSSTRTPASSRMTTVRTLRDIRPPRSSPHWLVYLAVGAFGGFLIFSLIGSVVRNWMTGESVDPEAAHGVSVGAPVPPPPPLPVLPAAEQGHDEAAQVVEAPAPAPAVASPSAPSASATVAKPATPATIRTNKGPAKATTPDIPSGI